MELDTMAISASAFLPFILALINQPHFSKAVKQIIALVAVVLVGVTVPMLNGEFDFTDILANIGVCFASMQSVYAGLNKTGVWDSIMHATSAKQTVEGLPNTAEQAVAPVGEEITVKVENKNTKAK